MKKPSLQVIDAMVARMAELRTGPFFDDLSCKECHSFWMKRGWLVVVDLPHGQALRIVDEKLCFLGKPN